MDNKYRIHIIRYNYAKINLFQQINEELYFTRAKYFRGSTYEYL